MRTKKSFDVKDFASSASLLGLLPLSTYLVSSLKNKRKPGYLEEDVKKEALVDSLGALALGGSILGLERLSEKFNTPVTQAIHNTMNAGIAAAANSIGGSDVTTIADSNSVGADSSQGAGNILASMGAHPMLNLTGAFGSLLLSNRFNRNILDRINSQYNVLTDALSRTHGNIISEVGKDPSRSKRLSVNQPEGEFFRNAFENLGTSTNSRFNRFLDNVFGANKNSLVADLQDSIFVETKRLDKLFENEPITRNLFSGNLSNNQINNVSGALDRMFSPPNVQRSDLNFPLLYDFTNKGLLRTPNILANLFSDSTSLNLLAKLQQSGLGTENPLTTRYKGVLEDLQGDPARLARLLRQVESRLFPINLTGKNVVNNVDMRSFRELINILNKEAPGRNLFDRRGFATNPFTRTFRTPTGAGARNLLTLSPLAGTILGSYFLSNSEN